jgi:hypothetical protein
MSVEVVLDRTPMSLMAESVATVASLVLVSQQRSEVGVAERRARMVVMVEAEAEAIMDSLVDQEPLVREVQEAVDTRALICLVEVEEVVVEMDQLALVEVEEQGTPE